MKRRIVFVTDCDDVAYNELRGVVLTELEKLGCDSEIEIEPVVSVKPFSIINGNFVLRLVAETYPPGTIFSVILNPVKDRPQRLLGRTQKKDFYFLGANTGVFDWFLKDFGIQELYELHDPGFIAFGGKYVHSPAVAQVAAGQRLSTLGKVFDPSKLRKAEIAEGMIVHIDNFGLAKFIGDLSGLAEGDKLQISVNGKTFSGIYATRMMNYDTGQWTIYPGSSFGLPELGKVRQDGAAELGLKIGDIITFRKI